MKLTIKQLLTAESSTVNNVRITQTEPEIVDIVDDAGNVVDRVAVNATKTLPVKVNPATFAVLMSNEQFRLRFEAKVLDRNQKRLAKVEQQEQHDDAVAVRAIARLKSSIPLVSELQRLA